MNHWMCDDKSPILPLRNLRQMCDGRPPEPKGDHSLVNQKGSNYFLRIDPNSLSPSRPWPKHLQLQNCASRTTKILQNF